MTSEVTLNLQPAATAMKTSRIARYAPVVVRVLLGLMFIVFGGNGLFHMLPEPQPQLPAGATAFMGALLATGYMFPLISATQFIAAVLLLSNRFVPLALALLAPFLVNSIAFHTFLEPSGRPLALILLGLELYLVWVYRKSYVPMLQAKVQPVA